MGRSREGFIRFVFLKFGVRDGGRLLGIRASFFVLQARQISWKRDVTEKRKENQE
jgi:hypothetical protein